LAADTLQMARQRPDFQLLAERTNLEGKRYYIFQRTEPQSSIEIGRHSSPDAAPLK
jgi:plasmid stabilization system protein ParE